MNVLEIAKSFLVESERRARGAALVVMAALPAVAAAASPTPQEGQAGDLTVSAATTNIVVGASTQLAVVDDRAMDRTAASTGTIYLPSNPQVLQVGPDGLVTALGTGISSVEVINGDVSQDKGPFYVGTILFVVGVNGDLDGDGMPDSWEILNGLSTTDPDDASGDPDEDGLLNLDEFARSTDPQDDDTDDDGHRDGREVFEGTDPTVPDPFVVLDERWILTVNGQSVIPNPDGTFVIPNVTVEDLSPTPPDFIGDNCLRLTGVSIREDGSVLYLWSEPFRLTVGSTFRVSNLTISNQPGYFQPESIRIAGPDVIQVGQSARMTVEGDFIRQGSMQTMVLDPSPFYPQCTDTFGEPPTIKFTSSNPLIATVGPTGVVTGQAVGRVYVTAEFVGVVSVRPFQISPVNDPLTEVVGFVQLEDGTPVTGASVTVQGLTGLSQGPDGRFAIPGAQTLSGPLQVRVDATVSMVTLRGISATAQPVPAAMTDVGLITLLPPGLGNRDYLFCFPRNWVGSTGLSVGITTDAFTILTVGIPGLGMSEEYILQPDSALTLPMPLNAELAGLDSVEAKAVSVSATGNVHVFASNRRATTSEAFLALPTVTFGTNYRILSFTPADAGSELAVVATDDATTVTIVPTAAAPGHPVGVAFNVSLDAFEAYQLQSSGGDLTGTQVTANKPIGVFGAQKCGRVPAGVDFCDYMVEQMPPVPTWGLQYYTLPLASRTGGDTFRILASTNATMVDVDDGTTMTQYPINNAGEFVDVVLTTGTLITSDKPILVAQYAHGTAFDGVAADPFMMLIANEAHWQTDYFFLVPSGYDNHFLNVVAPTSVASAGAVMMDGAPIAAGSFTPIAGTAYSGAQIASGGGSHRVTAPQPVAVYAYGFDSNNEGYGFPAGLALPFGN